MGNKPTKGKKGKSKDDNPRSPSSEASSPKPTPPTADHQSPDVAPKMPTESTDGEIHESWNDTVLFGDNQKVTNDDFELLNVIGKGSFGKVMQVKKKDDGKIYAMKVLNKEAIIARKQVAHTKAEKSILSKIQHPFIVHLHYAFQTKDKLYMILDFVNGGELFFHLKKETRFAEPRARFYAAQIVSAIAHLHSFDIVYRDLKPENILLNAQGHITITDFGLSKQINNEEGTHTFCGTPEYLAPEVLKGMGHGKAVDWWSLGTLVYEMLTGLPPFYSQNINIMYQKILSGELRFPSYVSQDAQSFLEGLLTREVDKRLGSGPDGANEIKRHPFFKEIDWEALERKEIEPPFKPKVRSSSCVNNFDVAFTNEVPTDSLPEGSTVSDQKDTHFDEFTYTAESTIKVSDD
ncbi:protein kinase 2 [Planoprotostelium fungivorum]|uniref:non-specific serine/threonine protein kinase n=1 Tax=Planoprotostelium fungivorum TaxID=1890364 RepID=A0A2P6N4S6_9EUKA|nr:protein kinase 2 [Planoprotostelium fungivorum]